jgi:aryl-alcohol dehydrogenase-like predicted oxidoreductase
MRFRTIPRTDITVSEIGFGCWTMGGPNFNPQTGQPIGWADVREDELLAGVKAGLDHGVNHWDNADVYGNGVAERRLAAAFARLGAKRSTQVIATKVGHFRGTAPHGYDPRHLRNQCEQSLRNLRTEYIDLYYFHHGTFTGQDHEGREHDYLHEAAATMHALVKEGKVRAIGQSAYSDDDFARAIPVVKPHVLQNKANLRYDDFIRPGCALQRLMKEHQCAFVAFGPLDQGVLLDKFDPEKPPAFGDGDYRNNRKDFNPATLRGVREALGKVRAKYVAGAADATRALSSIAQRWVLAHEHILGVIPGFRNERQALCNVAAADDPPMGAPDVEWLRGLFTGLRPAGK